MNKGESERQTHYFSLFLTTVSVLQTCELGGRKKNNRIGKIYNCTLGARREKKDPVNHPLRFE